MQCNFCLVFTPIFSLCEYCKLDFCLQNFEGGNINLHTVFKRFQSFVFCNLSWLLLAAVIVTGLIAGAFFAAQTFDSYVTMLHAVPGADVSVVGMFVCDCIPFIFAFLSVYCARPGLLYIICFCEALLMSHCGVSAWLAFGSSGWLARFFIQFSDIILSPVLCWFCIRHVSMRGRNLYRDAIICILILVVCVIINFCVFSPFLATL